MSPRRSAFIDVGTNTILCLIAEIRDTGRFRVLDDLAEITRLGEGVDRTGRIGAAAERRSLETLERFRGRCLSVGVEEFVAVGTSALRDAQNRDEVLGRLRARLGFDIRVISGAEEAAYSFLAVERGLPLLGSERLVIDIGGGSTEFIRGNAAGISRAMSIDIGTVRLTERFLHHDPVKDDEVARLMDALDGQLEPVLSTIVAGDSAVVFVGIAATFTTLVAMEKRLERYSHAAVHNSPLRLNTVRELRRRLQERSVAERKRMVGLHPERADVIFAGVCAIERIMTLWRRDSLIVSDQGVRFGLLHEAAGAP
jgi:exopolyphosphatase/guanosine-5'-triphosphate,3'-diphosphate pyrophosphatase